MPNYLDVLSNCFPDSQAYTRGDPTNYNDLSWITPQISQTTLDTSQCAIGSYTPPSMNNSDDVLIENGFKTNTDSTMLFNNVTRIFSITPINLISGFSFWSGSKKYSKYSSNTIAIGDVEGLHYIYFNDLGILQETQTYTDDLLVSFAIVTQIYWDATNKQAIIFTDERHGRRMDASTHVWAHNTFGALWDSGLAVTVNADGDGTSNSHAQFSISNGVIYDEDIQVNINTGLPQTLSPIATIPIFYRSGTSAWRKNAVTNYPVITTGTGRLAYNQNISGVWQLTETPSNNFTLIHLFALNDINNPIIGIIGQSTYSSLRSARVAALTEMQTLALSGFPIDEIKAIATIMFQTSSSYSNVVKSRVVSSQDSADSFGSYGQYSSSGKYIDWRKTNIQLASGTTPVDHCTLSGLTDDNHTQYHNDSRGDIRYFTQTQLNAGQLDNRYYTQAQMTALSSVKNIYSTTITPSTGTTLISQSSSLPATTAGTQIATITLTPVSTNSKFLIITNLFVGGSATSLNINLGFMKNGNWLNINTRKINSTSAIDGLTCNYLDSPSSSAQVVYSLRVGVSASGTWYINRTPASSTSLFGGISEPMSFFIIEF